MENRKIYIAGKISGRPKKEYRKQFNDYYEELRKKIDCRLIHNPAFYDEYYIGLGYTWEECLKSCLEHLMTCNEIHLLPGWLESRGATIEHSLAVLLKYKIVYVK